MILVTLGTQDKQFFRLLKAIDEQIEKGNIKDKVIVQAGYNASRYETKNMEMFDLIDREEFGKLVNECDYLITHGGEGSILNGVRLGKKIIACPRLAKYGEHLNDHQVQIVTEFSNLGYILPFNEDDDLGDVINKLKTFKPKKFVSNTENFIKVIKNYIDNN